MTSLNAEYFYQQGNLAQSLEDYHKAIALNSQDAEAYYYRGYIYLLQNNL